MSIKARRQTPERIAVQSNPEQNFVLHRLIDPPVQTTLNR